MSSEGKHCPNCGASLEDFRRTGLFGCAQCYDVFREEVRSAVKKVQGGSRHIGNAPAPEGNKYVLVIEQEMLLESLSRSLKEGKHQEADKMQHRLEEIESILHPEDVT